MYETDSPDIAAEPNGVSLMRKFCDVSEAIAQAEREQQERADTIAKWRAEQDSLRHQVLDIVQPINKAAKSVSA